MTPLHVAAERGHAQICYELISHNADLNIIDNDGNTYIHLHN